MFDVYVQEKAFEKAKAHFENQASAGLEGLGLLLGGVFSSEGRKYVVVEDYVTAENDATAVSVRFSREAFSELSEKLSSEEGAKIIVGWCHSHPGYGCFLSSVDVRTHKVFFPEDFHFAMVFDPKAQEGKGEWKVFKLSGGKNYSESSFAVIRKK